MTDFIISGGLNLQGNLPVFGAKNACLPLICSTVLSKKEKVSLSNIPKLRDIELLVDILKDIGCHVNYDINKRTLDVIPNIEKTEIGEKANKMRASILLMAPLLAIKGSVSIPFPGGCGIGGRPIDITLDGFRALGVEFQESKTHLIGKTSGLKGTKFKLHFPSVGATENLIMAATLAEGETIFENIAIEPEIQDTIDLLNSMGAKIEFIEERTVKIQGVKILHGAEHEVIPDRIITGTYAVIGALCAGDEGIEITNCKPELLKNELAVLQKAGVKMEIREESIFIPKQKHNYKAGFFETSVYSDTGFATDLQAPLMMFLTQTEGTSKVVENIYENRFMHVKHLNNMNAHINILSRTDAIIEGPTSLKGANVESTDLRASAALVIAGLIAEGETVLSGIEHLDRGYENLDLFLNQIGAKIERRDN